MRSNGRMGAGANAATRIILHDRARTLSHSENNKDMRSRKMRKYTLIIAVLYFTVYELLQLHGKYGELFYMETFLPQPDLPLQPLSEKSAAHWNGTTSSPRILCLIITSPSYHKTRAVHVAATWARHCNRAIFVTSKKDKDLPDSFVVAEAEGYYDLWRKVSKGFEMVYEQDLISSYDWFLKVDDDTFVFMDNLKKALRVFDPNQKLAAGHKLLTWEESEVYLNGGAGYVLSKASVGLLVTKGLKEKLCEQNLNFHTGEDVKMAFCLAHLGVTLMELQDTKGKSQFHIYPPQEELDPRQAYTWSHLWLKKISVNPYLFGFANLTREPISFHYVNAETMYLLYYLAYVINPCFQNQDNGITENAKNQYQNLHANHIKPTI